MSSPSHDLDTDLQPEPNGGRDRRVPRWVTWTVGGLILAVVLFFGAIFLYAKVLNDSPDKFSEADIDERIAAEASGQDVAAESTPAITEANDPAASGESAPGAAGGSWVATDQSEVGYRVKEILFGVDTEGVGRTNQVTGSLTIDGTSVTATEFTVDVATITSDESRRDNQFRGRIMSTDEFPTATFVLTQPIELGVEPADGAAVTASATGELTLRGVTNTVTFDVTAKQDSGLIGVQGSIPVVFADYGIANPSTGGITTEDKGLVEFVLVFQPA